MTPIDIFDTWQKIMSEVNTQQGGIIRPQTDFQNWFNDINNDLFWEYCALFERGQLTTDVLAPFSKSINVVVIPQPGLSYDLIPYPADYGFFKDIRVLRQKNTNMCGCNTELPILCEGKLISCEQGEQKQYIDPEYAKMLQDFAQTNLVERLAYKVNTQNWTACLNHPNKAPTFDNPKCTQFNQGLMLAPKGIQVVILDYFSYPVQAVFSYTIGSNDEIIYNPSGSTQLQWSNTLQPQFLQKLRKKYNVYISDPTGEQIAENDRKNTFK